MKKNTTWIHVTIWLLMIVYLAFAPSIINKYFVKEGKPVFVDKSLPVETNKIRAYIDQFQPIVYQGQSLYNIVGWSFSTVDLSIPPDAYTRYLILVSTTTNYYYMVSTYERPDIEKAFPDIGLDLTDTGFRVMVAKELIKPGTYQIGMVFYQDKSKLDYYALTNRYLIRTKNELFLKDIKGNQ